MNVPHLRALLKKNLLIFKSTYILTIIELLSPIIVMLLLLGLKSLFDTENLEFQDDLEYIVNNSTLMTNYYRRVIEERISYRGSIYMCLERYLIAFVGENFPEELSQKFKAHKWEQEFIQFKNYNDLSELLKYVKSKEYGSDRRKNPKLCFAVSFKSEHNKYSYKLHYFASPYRTDPPDRPSTEMGVGDPLNKQPDYESYERYLQSGFFMSQKYFYDYVLQKETGNPDADITYIIGPKKYDKYVKDSFANYISLLLAFFSIIAYALPLTINIYRMVKEKETRAKEGMKIMGLSELTYFLSYFIIYFVINLFYSICNALVLKNVLIYIDTIYIFILYFLYGLVIYSLIYFFQSFLERTRIAIIVSLLIYALMFFFSIPVETNSVSKGVKYIISIIFPPVSLDLGINTLSLFEENMNEFNGRINYDFNNFNIFDMYITFICSFILFMFIGFYLQNILSHEYGIKKPLYFICTKNFWGCENKKNVKYKEMYNEIDHNINILINKEENSEQNKISTYSPKESNKNSGVDNKAYNTNVSFLPKTLNEKNNNNLHKDSHKNESSSKDEFLEIKEGIKKDNNSVKDYDKNRQVGKEDCIEIKEGNINEIKNEINQNINEEKNVMSMSQNKNFKLNNSLNSELNFQSEELYQVNNKSTDKLRILNIYKTFEDGKKALNGVSFNLYKNEIFALLGHNGAGKSTLINILTGLYPTTAGSAIYNNENIITSEGLDDFRKYLGICPQHDVLFDDLTVEEHLEMFCVFKSVPKEKIENEITKIIKDFDLVKKRKTKACNLSGGQKRKLSICIALVGGSSVIFLDEPTSGMDITSRRNLWDILKRYANGRIIILTTHYMEEASVLGNRIGILSEGRMKCIGSPLFLIEKFGKNINLNITKEINANNDKIIGFISDNIKDADIEYEIFTEEILFKIPKDSKNFERKKFFKILDDNCKNLNIKSYSISMSTLEDVFINVSKITKKKNKLKNNLKIEEIDEEERAEKIKREENYKILYDDNNYNEKYSFFSKILRDTKVSIKRRLIQIYRDKKTFFLEILCPILLALIGCAVCSFDILEKNKVIKFNINGISNDKQIINFYPSDQNINTINQIIYDYTSEDISNIIFNQINVDEGYSETELTINFMNKIFEIEKNYKEKNYANYIFNYIDKKNQQYEFICLIDLLTNQNGPIFTNYIIKNIIRYATNNKNLEIEVINEPLPYTYEERSNSKERKSSMLLFFISICFTLIPSNFITIIIKEKENNSKHLQIISGISLMSYWVNNYIFELGKYYIIGGVCILFLKIFGFYEDFVYILYLLYGPSMVSFTYLFSFIFKKEGAGQTMVIIVNLIIGALGGTAVFIMRISEKLIKYAKTIAYIFRIIPSFCFCYGYNCLLNRYWIFAADLQNEFNGENYELSWSTAYLMVLSRKKNDILKLKYMGSDCIYLAVESAVYLLILVFLENFEKLFSFCFTSDLPRKNKNIKFKNITDNKNDRINKNNQDIKNIDDELNVISIPDNVNDTYVKNEILKSKNENNNTNYAIKIISLIKTYYGGPFGFKIFDSCFKSTDAVREISLCLEYGECFGFLGVNGAGKTTTFKCLSKEILPTYGKIYIDNKEVNEDFDKVRSLIGYCPQFDAIFESLTVYENLEFYGIIKGAKKDKIKNIVYALMDEMSLLIFKDKVSGTLSGGNKRKLSVAIAMICNPPIILLDEPSTGMDPEARRFMWSVIHRISFNRKKSTIIMTTHSMEEAETLCKRIGIMVDGQFKCLSTSDEIKEKYGYGYEISLQINNPNLEELYKKYNISEEEQKIKITLNKIEEFLKKYNLEKFNSQLQKEFLGGKIIEEIEACEYVYIHRIISWIYYLENALKMIKILLDDFPEIHCTDYAENNLIFKIKRNKNGGEKSIGYLFGIIEENKSKYNIEQYFLQLSSLEQIFNNFAKKTEKIDNNIEFRNIDIPITKELISSLFGE